MGQLLEVQGLTKQFGDLVAVSDVSFAVDSGEIFGIIGPNGAGKTTLFNVIAGHYQPNAGRVTFEGNDITGWSSNRIARAGIGRTFQAIHLFRQETVAENLRRAAVIGRYATPFSYVARHKSPGAADPAEISDFIGLSEMLDGMAGSLAYGLQKMLGIGMAMIISPKLLLMDEPVAGLNPSEKRAAGQLIRRLRDERGISIILVEQNAKLALKISDQAFVLKTGSVALEGSSAELLLSDRVHNAYLGGSQEH